MAERKRKRDRAEFIIMSEEELRGEKKKTHKVVRQNKARKFPLDYDYPV